MRRLNKNFNEKKKTVEVMYGKCSMYGTDCACDPVDCVCGGTKVQYDTFKDQTKNYLNAFKVADF